MRRTLSRVPFASVTLDSTLVYGCVEPWLASALAGSASTLAVLRGLATTELLSGPDPALAAFTRLRALTLHQTSNAPLSAAQLPTSLELLRFEYAIPRDSGGKYVPPLLAAFGRLDRLRRLTFCGYISWPLGSCSAANKPGRLALPPSVQVSAAVPEKLSDKTSSHSPVLHHGSIHVAQFCPALHWYGMKRQFRP